MAKKFHSTTLPFDFGIVPDQDGGERTRFLALYTYDFATYYPRPHVPIWEIAWGAVFTLNLGAVFIGYKAHRTALVTLGFVMLGIIILSFYCRLAGSMLSTGMLFLSAGTLLIILIFTLHKLRKSILQ